MDLEDLIEEINEEYDKKTAKLNELHAAATTYRQKMRVAKKIAEQTGMTTEEVLIKNLIAVYPDGIIPEADLKVLTVSALRHNYEYVSGVAADAQAALNSELGIGMKPVVPKFNSAAAEAIAEDAAKFGSVLEDGNLQKQIVTNSLQVLDDSVMANAEAHENAGLEVRVIRVYDGVGLHNGKDPCQLCMSRSGEWSYADAQSNSVFARHEGCGCEIYYKSSRNWEYSKGHGNQWRDVTEDEVVNKRIRYRKG